jgi:hypothetical protein
MATGEPVARQEVLKAFEEGPRTCEIFHLAPAPRGAVSGGHTVDQALTLKRCSTHTFFSS